jgi:hypothetical protein
VPHPRSVQPGTYIEHVQQLVPRERVLLIPQAVQVSHQGPQLELGQARHEGLKEGPQLDQVQGCPCPSVQGCPDAGRTPLWSQVAKDPLVWGLDGV